MTDRRLFIATILLDGKPLEELESDTCIVTEIDKNGVEGKGNVMLTPADVERLDAIKCEYGEDRISVRISYAAQTEGSA